MGPVRSSRDGVYLAGAIQGPKDITQSVAHAGGAASAAAQPLDEGVYLWRIQLGMVTSSGTELIESPVFAFRVEDPSRLGEIDDNGTKAEVMRILEDLLGNRGRNLAEALSDYNLTAIRVNGETITKKRLYEIIEGYQGEERLISDIMLKGTQ